MKKDKTCIMTKKQCTIYNQTSRFILWMSHKMTNTDSNLCDQVLDHIENECSICLTTIHPKDIKTLSCKHSFHSHCITPWKIRNSSCPICRNDSGRFAIMRKRVSIVGSQGNLEPGFGSINLEAFFLRLYNGIRMRWSRIRQIRNER